MISDLSIENLRGIERGSLTDLAPLTVLTGPNACGKSTVLDALLVGTSRRLDDALGLAVSRHPLSLSGAQWFANSPSEITRIEVTESEFETGHITNLWTRLVESHTYCIADLAAILERRGAQRPLSMLTATDCDLEGGVNFKIDVGFGSDNQFISVGGVEDKSPPQATLVDPGLPRSLHRDYSQLVKAGLQDSVYQYLRQALPGLEELQILVGDSDAVELHIRRQGVSVPVPLSGDGVQALLQVILQVSVLPTTGLVLLEEPEVYLHPRAIWQVARFLMDRRRAGLQVILTTHSLELIDALINQASEDDLASMAVFNLALKEQTLLSSRRQGEEIRFARDELEKDLR